MGKICSNCGYERKPDDPKPEYKCPKCGRVYFKSSGKSSNVDESAVRGVLIGSGSGLKDTGVKSDNVNKSAAYGQKNTVDKKESQKAESDVSFVPFDSYSKGGNFLDSYGYVPAGFFRRLVAYFIDTFAFSIISVLGIVVWAVHNNTLGYYVGMVLFIVLYKPVMETLFGGTLGKFFLGVRVVKKDGDEINAFQGIVRNIFFMANLYMTFLILLIIMKMIGSANIKFSSLVLGSASIMGMKFIHFFLFYKLIPIIIMFDSLFIIFSSRKRALHDLLAGTYCIVV